MTGHPVVVWEEGGEARSARWRAEGGLAPPRRVLIADDRMTAEAAYRLACEGTALLWRGDFQNARQLLQAMARRADKGPRRAKKKSAMTPAAGPAESFHLHRLAQSRRARMLAMLLLPFDAHPGGALRPGPGLVVAAHRVLDAGRTAHGPAGFTSCRVGG